VNGTTHSNFRAAALLALAGFAVVWAPARRAAAADAEPHDHGWVLRFDNDLLKPGERDRDYTFGVAFTRGSDGPVEGPRWLARALDWADGALHVPRDAATRDGRAFELGLQLFTPRDLTTEEPIPDDRPYANLLYAASSRLTLDAAHRAVYQSTLTLGVLGLPVVGDVHRAAHDLLDSPLPNGYDHQISDGGEPTFRYAFAKQRLLASGARNEARPYSVRVGFGASVGYITEASALIAFRSGPERVPWWSAPPLPADYAGQPTILPRREGETAAVRGVVYEAGVAVRARAYNAFLQGQVRHSDVTFAADELNHLLLEAWLGFSIVQKNGISVSYTLRWQSPEIEEGTGSRSFSWGSLSFVRRF